MLIFRRENYLWLCQEYLSEIHTEVFDDMISRIYYKIIQLVRGGIGNGIDETKLAMN